MSQSPAIWPSLVVVRVLGEDGFTEFEPWTWRHPRLGGGMRRIRDGLAVIVAGVVAAELSAFWFDEGRLPTEADRRFVATVLTGLGFDPSRPLISSYVRRGEVALYGEPHDDSTVAVSMARAVAEGLWAKGVAARYGQPRLARLVCPRPASRAAIADEIGRAERRASRILRRRWDDLLKVAASLRRRKSGRMTARQVLRLLGSS